LHLYTDENADYDSEEALQLIQDHFSTLNDEILKLRDEKDSN